MPPSSFTFPEAYYNTRSAEVVLPMLIRMFEPSSILDVGCGNGSWLLAAKQLGIRDVLGLDLEEDGIALGNLQEGEFRKQDLSEPFDLGRQFDLVLCLEVAEHLPPDAALALVQSLARHGKRIVFSAAIPRQGGEGHIHEQEPGYWQSLFNQQGYKTYDDIRPGIWSDDSVFWWYRQNIFLAIREDLATDRPSEEIAHLVHPELFRETSGFRILAEYKLEELRQSREASENFWKAQDSSIRYHVSRLLQLVRKRILSQNR